MIKTIHGYLTRDLARIWVLALFALTLMLTIFSVIEPLRKQQGVTFEQMASFFGFMIPSMLSLTLPVSALFAATIVYGRFSQDNEHLACRAGGVSTMAVLQPAVGLGVFVTALSLLLSNYVAPNMMKRGMATLEQNPKAIIYRQLETKHYFRRDDNYIHADRVDAENDTLYGVVYAKWSPSRREGVVVGDKVRLTDVYTVTRVEGELHDLTADAGQPHVVAGAAHTAVHRDALLAVNKRNDDELAAGDKVRLADVWRVRKINTGETSKAPKTYDLRRDNSRDDRRDNLRQAVPASRLLPLPKRDTRIMVAAQAKVTLHDNGPQPYIELELIDLVAKRVTDGAGNLISEGRHQRLRYVPAPPTYYKPAWMTWDELVAVAANPARHPAILFELDKLRRELRSDYFSQDLREQIESHKEYRRLSGVTAVANGPPITREFVLRADRFEETVGFEEGGGKRGASRLGCRLFNADGSPVQLEIWEVRTGPDGRPERPKRQTVSSRPGGDLAVGVESDELTQMTYVYLAMPGEVDVFTEGEARPQRFADFSVGQLAIPPELLRAIDEYDNETLFAGSHADGRKFSSRPFIQRRIRNTLNISAELSRAIRAEIHVRMAYSSSCLLMVMLGAALGLMFRGGQFLTAFAIAAVPGAIVIVFLLMGKGMVKKIEDGYGLLAIWGGIVFLAVATSIVYLRLARRHS